MGYIEKIKSLTEDRYPFLGAPAPLNVPIMVFTLGLDESERNMLREEIRNRWNAPKRYVRLCEITLTDNRRPALAKVDIPDAEGATPVYGYSMPFYRAWNDQYRLGQLNRWLNSIITHTYKELGTLRDYRLNIVCRAEKPEALWADEVMTLTYDLISRMGGSVVSRDLFALLPENNTEYEPEMKIFGREVKAWDRHRTEEKIRLVQNVDRQWSLVPCTDYFGKNTPVFGHMVMLDGMNSAANPYPMRDRLHLAALLMEPDQNIEWLHDTEADDKQTHYPHIFSAWLYERYADRHEWDLTLGWEACQDKIRARLAGQASFDCSRDNARLLQTARERISSIPGRLQGFRFAAMQELTGSRVSATDRPERIFHGALANEMDRAWVNIALGLRDEALPEWQESVRGKLAGIFNTDDLANIGSSRFQIRDSDAGSAIPMADRKLSDDIAADRQALAQGLAAAYREGYHIGKLKAVFENLEDDPVVGAVFDKSVNALLDEMIQARKDEIGKLKERLATLDGEQKIDRGVFEDALYHTLGENSFLDDAGQRKKDIGSLLEEKVYSGFEEALMADAEDREDKMVRVLEKIRDALQGQRFEPVLKPVPAEPDSLDCRLSDTVRKNGTYRQIPGGRDRELWLYIEQTDPVRIKLLQQEDTAEEEQE